MAVTRFCWLLGLGIAAWAWIPAAASMTKMLRVLCDWQINLTRWALWCVRSALKSLVLAQLAEKAMILGIGMLTVQEERR